MSQHAAPVQKKSFVQKKIKKKITSHENNNPKPS